MNNRIPKLPTYSCSENNCFHPVFLFAMQRTLKQKRLDHIEVKKQYYSPTGPIDLVLFNKNTQKVILPIEIKRTQSNVRGGGRRQARDYWQNLGSSCETPFYCVSNLELTELFRYEQARPKTSAQQVRLQQPIIGPLEPIPFTEDFYNDLLVTLSEILDLVLGHKPYIYAVGLPELQGNLESVVDNTSKWHQILIPTCFEYIRGAATKIQHLNNQPWKPASFFAQNPDRLLSLGRGIDFEHSFKDPAPAPNDTIAFSQTVLDEAYSAGRELGFGDEIAELINEILWDITPKKQGIVETDTELAGLLAVIAKVTLGRELKENEKVMDPASGSGRLLTILPKTAFRNITSKQIKAIEKEPLFAETLSLRLGLAFATTISPLNAPSVLISGVELATPKDFEDVKVVVMNPPFISGIHSSAIKPSFAKRIQEITGQKSKLNYGQIALEILFLELIYNLAPEGAVISVIFPSNHLFRSSKEVGLFRKFLLEDFGLKYIVVYPRKGLFSSVIKETVILSGVKGHLTDNVKLIQVYKSINDVNMAGLEYELRAQLNKSIPNLCIISDYTYSYTIPCSILADKIESGWQTIFGAKSKGTLFVEEKMTKFCSISSLNPTRGVFGNKGNNSLTVINKTNPKYPTILAKIPSHWLIPLLNNTESIPRKLSTTTAPQISFTPPSSAYNSQTQDYLALENIIQEYLSIHTHSQGTQKKLKPNRERVIASLQSNDCIYSNCVLLPRGSRTKGEVSIIGADQVIISTNVLMIPLSDSPERELMGSWLLSIFGQLQLELYCISQEGMRKLEISNLKKLKYPDFTQIEHAKTDRLRQLFYTEEALIFNDIQKREIDYLWAESIWPKNAMKVLNDAFDIFQEIIDDRTGFG